MKWSVFSSAASLFSELNRYEMIFSPGTLDAKMSHSELLRVFSGLESSMLNASAKKPARGLSLFADQVMLCSDAEYPISQSVHFIDHALLQAAGTDGQLQFVSCCTDGRNICF